MFVVLLGLVGAGGARAAFPGRDGILALQPLSGSGVVIAGTDGRHARRVCTSACGASGLPRFAPDGRSLIVATRYGLKLLAVDGSCLDCQFDQARSPAFLPNGTELTGLVSGHLDLEGIDSLRRAVVLDHHVHEAVWSSRGALAIAVGGRIEIGSPSQMRTVGRGQRPLSFSPSGRALAYVSHGWVMLFDGRHSRRLVRGTGPAFAPDGRALAYLARGGRVRILTLATGRSRPAGTLRARGVDWQPLPDRRSVCAVPPGSSVVASSPEAVITSSRLQAVDSETGTDAAYMGCLRSDGRARLLVQDTIPTGEDSYNAGPFAVGGTFAALFHNFESHYGSGSGSIEEFDLRTGVMTNTPLVCPSSNPAVTAGIPCEVLVKELVVAPDGAYAFHGLIASLCYPGAAFEDEIVAVDRSGTRTLDQAMRPDCNSPALLSGLAISGQTVTWDHAGDPAAHSATLN